MEKYSRGRRGAPAKGVGRVYRRESSNLSFSAKNKGYPNRGIPCFLRSGDLIFERRFAKQKGAGSKTKTIEYRFWRSETAQSKELKERVYRATRNDYATVVGISNLSFSIFVVL